MKFYDQLKTRLNSEFHCKGNNGASPILVLLVACIFGSASSAFGADGVELEDSREFSIAATKTGRDYRIWVSEPAKPAPPEGYSVIYVLDSAQMFPILSAANKAYARSIREPRALVVGIGYAADANVVEERSLDLTPFYDESFRLKSGGAADFLTFINNDLKPAIEADYSVNKNNQSLYGHSFGGLFALYTLFTEPDSFQKYAIASPSMWFANEQIFELQNQLTAQNSAGINVMLAVGEFEQKLSPKAKNLPNVEAMKQRFLKGKLVTNTKALAADLGAFMPVEFREIPGANHVLAGRASAVHALPFIYAD